MLLLDALRGPVHPRACGEQVVQEVSEWVQHGSSPRLRGTVPKLRKFSPYPRFIPAPAGNRTSRGSGLRRSPVHPRACGEQRPRGPPQIARHGSSPRLRGTVGKIELKPFFFRFIPAPAGNSVPAMATVYRDPVHPRACGEQLCLTRIPARMAGSSPRLRGTGTGGESRRHQDRFIPAPAGNSALPPPVIPPSTVHPRACGEQPISSSSKRTPNGSSPRLRGTELWQCRSNDAIRFIPAPAGNSKPCKIRLARWSVHPRACGEQFAGSLGWILLFGSSPRLRGTVSGAGPRVTHNRFIPAPAGNRCQRSKNGGLCAVHPRACGEQGQSEDSLLKTLGSSPRLRGTDPFRVRIEWRRRFIPAPAGNRSLR